MTDYEIRIPSDFCGLKCCADSKKIKSMRERKNPAEFKIRIRDNQSKITEMKTNLYLKKERKKEKNNQMKSNQIYLEFQENFDVRNIFFTMIQTA